VLTSPNLRPEVWWNMAVVLNCPLCVERTSKRIVETYSLTVNKEGHATEAGGLRAYQCLNGHIFFVRACELELLAHSAVVGNG
jgi:hypothetical protein